MPSFPNSIYSPREVEDKSGVVYDADKTTVVFAKDKNDSDDEIVAIETLLETRLDQTSPYPVKLAVPSADHSADGIIVARLPGESVAFGQPCYVKSDGKMWKADADAIATASAVAIALETKDADESCKFLLFGFAKDESWSFDIGGLVYLSTDVGVITKTAPSGEDDVIQILGVAISADTILFNPQLVQVEHI